MSKLITFSAPSGSGKTTIVEKLISDESLNLAFSVSATTRPKRDYEIHGKHYYFLSKDEFLKKVQNDEFVEWEEVYEGMYYGTLKSEIERLLKASKNIIFDIDIKGSLNIKKYYPDITLTIFVVPPSFEELVRRLKNRGSEDENTLQKRLQRYEFEMSFANSFDKIVVNDQLDKAIEECKRIILDFIKS